MKRLIDSHIHFWNPDRLRYEWLNEVPQINKSYSPTQLAHSAADLPLQKIVFVQADCIPDDSLNEVAWVSALAESEPRIQGIVAFAPLEAEDADHHLAQLANYPLVKGIRRLIQSESVSFAADPDLIRGVQKLAAYNYTFDICIRHEQLPAAIELVSRCPEVQFVLDHFGKPAIKAGVLEPWASDLRHLADLPNVWCKLSGLVTEADWAAWKPADLQPYIDQVLTVFGSERLMFGGDWPVSELATDYSRWVQTAAAAVSHLPDHEQDKIFYTNAANFYGLSSAS